MNNESGGCRAGRVDKPARLTIRVLWVLVSEVWYLFPFHQIMKERYDLQSSCSNCLATMMSFDGEVAPIVVRNCCNAFLSTN